MDPAPDTPEIDPYAVLGVPTTSTAAEIRSAYRKLALSTHPDKVPVTEREAAHKKFQELAFAYSVLSDESRRKRYDETGSTKESVLDDEDFDWRGFFKAQYETVGKEAIEAFRKEYQGSEEEREAVLEAYTSSKGSMDEIFEHVMVSSVLDDEARFRSIIDAAIETGEVESFKAYTKETESAKKARRKKASKESKEAIEYAKELGVHDALFGEEKEKSQHGDADEDESKSKSKRTQRAQKRAKPKAKKEDTSALENLIKSRNKNRMDDLVDSLEAKYGGEQAKKKIGKKAVQDEEEPNEEEFQAAQAKLGRKRDAEPVKPSRTKRAKK